MRLFYIVYIKLHLYAVRKFLRTECDEQKKLGHGTTINSNKTEKGFSLTIL